MNKTVKRILLSVLVLVLALVGAFGAVMFSTFNGRLPQTDVALKDGTQPIVDGYVNAYAIPLTDPHKVALVDCGNDVQAAEIKKVLAAHQWSVAAIFVTHGHPDHIGGCAQFPGAPVYASEREVALIEGKTGAHGPLTQLFGAKDLGVRVTNPLKDDSDVEVDGVKVHAYAVTGHTAGSLVYRIRSTLFFGDAATGKDPGIVVGPPWVFSDDMDLGMRSLGGLATTLDNAPGHSADVETYAFAHSGALPAKAELLIAASAPKKKH